MSKASVKSAQAPAPKFMRRRANILELDEQLRDELTKKGLSFKWINFQDFKSKGVNSLGFIPYKRESKAPLAELLQTGAPDGYTVKGDLILAVMPKSEHAELKAEMKWRAQRGERYQEEAGAELAESLRRSGIKSKVITGVNDDE